jgi:uncharacterized protein
MFRPSSQKLGINRLFLTLALVFVFASGVAPAFLHARPAPAMAAVDSPAVIGNWEGSISAGGTTLRLVIHITQDKNAALTGTMDSLDQGANGIPLINVSYKEPKAHFEIGGDYPGIFDGSYDKSKEEISGHWMQAGQDFPLVLKRAK